MDASEVIKACNNLRTFWSTRNTKFKDWYKVITLNDEFKQEGIESFVSNDPQSTFKLMRHLLDQKIPHRVPVSELTPQLMKQASELEILYDTCWNNIFDSYRRRGRQGWLWDLIGYVLATGWYSVMSYINPADGATCVAEVLNPATVYPIWEDRMVTVAHVDSLSPIGAKILAYRNGFNIDEPRGKVHLFDYWRLDERGDCFNSIVIDRKLVKSDVQAPFPEIPIFISPLGGLPDNGTITGDSDRWKGEIGQSIVATNEGIYKSVNKWWSYMMQVLRDTAQFRILEKSDSGKPIVRPEDIFKRGAIFRMKTNESVEALVPPALPTELRSTQLDLEAMEQRGGGVSFSALGNYTNSTMTSYVMSQMAAVTIQAARPFHKGIIDCISDIDNFWFKQMETSGYKPYGKSLPKGLPDNLRISAEYEVKVPGDLIQRATTARMLDPDFRLSYSRVSEELFPEIKNPMAEVAKVRADKAESNPINSLIALIESFRIQSKLLEGAGDTIGARLYDKAADKLEASLDMSNEVEGATGVASPRQSIGTRTEALPPEQATTVPPEA